MRTLNKKETIKNIMTLLDNGFTVYIDNGELWLSRCSKTNRKIIKWHCFGSSANRRNLRELTWIINTIFKCKYKNIVYTYK